MDINEQKEKLRKLVAESSLVEGDEKLKDLVLKKIDEFEDNEESRQSLDDLIKFFETGEEEVKKIVSKYDEVVEKGKELKVKEEEEVLKMLNFYDNLIDKMVEERKKDPDNFNAEKFLEENKYQ